MKLTKYAPEATWRAFSKPWKTNLQDLVDEIDQTFVNISHFHGLLEGRVSHALGRESLKNSQQSLVMHQQSLNRLAGVEHLLEHIHATIVRFSNEHDVQQTANLLGQRIDEDLQEPDQRRSSAIRPDEAQGVHSLCFSLLENALNTCRNLLSPTILRHAHWARGPHYAMKCFSSFETSMKIYRGARKPKNRLQRCVVTGRSKEI